METEKNNNPIAEVIAVFPNKVKIAVHDLSAFASVDSQLEKLRVGSYLEVSDDENVKLIVIIECYSIEYFEKRIKEEGHEDKILNNKRYIIEANPLGTIVNGKFDRGGDSLTIPPTRVKPASFSDVLMIYQSELKLEEKFCFASLLADDKIKVPVNGNKFFNKHFAIVGSTGSGKSNTVAKVLQEAIKAKKESGFTGLNNSHIVIFDIHKEYGNAFPEANYISIENLILPYWLLNADELEELFLDSGDRNNYNQTSILRRVIIENKKSHNPADKNVHFDSPHKFDINEVANCLCNLQSESVNYKNSSKYMIVDDEKYTLRDGGTTIESGIELTDTERYNKYFSKKWNFHPNKNSNITNGIYADGTLDKFVDRFENKINNKRLEFLLGDKSRDSSFIDTIKQFIGFSRQVKNEVGELVNVGKSNITIIDLGGIPFEVLSITVSLISRILFEFGYHSKKLLKAGADCETPLLLVYEEAHKYVPKSDLVKFRSSKEAIERIAKEGRKYGVTLGIISQRPSEISETIFSQCNSFITMRLSNPDDQNYVKKLLPDTLGNLTDMLPSLKAGDALLVGESIIIPSLVHVEKCDPEPKSSDIKYFEVWKEEWKEVDFKDLIDEWGK